MRRSGTRKARRRSKARVRHATKQKMVPRTLFFALMIATGAAAAEDCTHKSGANTVALVELFTSEGCSSCPPADRWISGFVNHPQVERFVPLSFHVNYWDDLGWKDRFADQRYTERQRALAKATGANMVYTPQVTLQGRDAREWRSETAFATRIEAINKSPPRAALTLRVKAAADGGVAGAVSGNALSADTASRDLALFVVLTQDGLSSKVTAGENGGATLRHNFVVREMATSRSLQDFGFIFKPKADYDVTKMRVAAFVQNVKTGEVLQALSAPICK